jgi:hypothetical protein
MKKKQRIIVIALLVVAIVAGPAIYFMRQPSDKCTEKDRQQNNCVPAGRCTPPGDPREATIDCELKNYDHKFK